MLGVDPGQVNGDEGLFALLAGHVFTEENVTGLAPVEDAHQRRLGRGHWGRGGFLAFLVEEGQADGLGGIVDDGDVLDRILARGQAVAFQKVRRNRLHRVLAFAGHEDSVRGNAVSAQVDVGHGDADRLGHRGDEAVREHDLSGHGAG